MAAAITSSNGCRLTLDDQMDLHDVSFALRHADLEATSTNEARGHTDLCKKACCMGKKVNPELRE